MMSLFMCQFANCNCAEGLIHKFWRKLGVIWRYLAVLEILQTLVCENRNIDINYIHE